MNVICGRLLTSLLASPEESGKRCEERMHVVDYS